MKIEIEREDDGRWLGEVPELPGVMAYGADREEAMARVKALAERVMADRLEHGEDDRSSQSYVDPMLESLVSSILIVFFWTAYAFCWRVDNLFPEDSRVGVVLVIVFPSLLLGMIYGFKAFEKWRVIYKEHPRSALPWPFWLGVLLLLPASLSIPCIALIMLHNLA